MPLYTQNVQESVSGAAVFASATLSASRAISHSVPAAEMALSHISGVFIWAKVDDVPGEAAPSLQRVERRVFGQSLRPRRPRYAEGLWP